MLKRASIFLIFALFLGFGSYAQQSAAFTSEYADYQHGLKLYNQHQFSGAQRIFERVHKKTEKPTLKAETAYYGAMAAVQLQQPDAEKRMRSFVIDYPESPRRNSAYSNVAEFYFNNGQFAKAKDWYDRVNVSDLTSSEAKTYYFNKGYAAFQAGDAEQAQRLLSRVENDAKYGSQAKYYMGYLAYEGEDYQRATEFFEEVDEEDRQSQKVSYFQSNISFQAGEFEKAIAQAKEQLSQSNRLEQSELNKIIGESYFNLNNYEEAIPYLEKYQGKRGRWNNTDYYQLGYAYYKRQDYQKAIDQFNKIIDGKNSVAQNAYYHLAECYIHLDQKQQALNAFKNASEMDFDGTIKEDAALNYAKLSYEIGNNYKSIPEVLTQFLDDYPLSSSRDAIQELLVDSYVTSKNYKKAMELLEGSDSFEDQSVYQIVAFYRGLELYGEEDYEEAKHMFEQSLTRQRDPEFTARATYWKAETDYNLQNYGEALIGYKEFKGMTASMDTPEFKDIDYNIGYAYFNQKRYEQAADYFLAYADKSSITPAQKNDAYLRLGDAYFAQSSYWKAMEEYNKAIAQEGINSDYAHFQKAISYGFVDRNQRKIEDLEQFITQYPKSIYRDDALYELGNTYVAENQAQKAIQTYDKIVRGLPNSSYISRSLMKQGLIYYNTDQNQKALEKFRKVAAEYPNTEEAVQAVRSARNIYVDIGKTDEYASWVKTLDFVEVTDSDIDDAAYESAENQFIDQKDDAAIKSFKQYLKKFPNGAHALSAHYHLGQLLYKQKDYKGAEPHYAYVVDQARNENTEPSLERLGRIYLETNAQQKAIPILKRLEEEAKFQQNISFAQSNLMKVYYEQKDYPNTVAYAEKVLANSKADQRAQSDAHIFIARSAMETGNEAKAKTAYAEVAKMAEGRLAAEAQYYDAYFKRKSGNYKASNESVQVLARDFSGYREFSVKGLLLMGKNFYDLEDAYQATYILQNVVDNFEEFPEVVAEAKRELSRIRAEEAKTNASIHNPAEDEFPIDND